MSNLFNSVISDSTMTPGIFFLCLGVALLSGFLLSFLCYYKSESSKSFFITTAILPAVVSMVIILVNGNIGAGVAVAGAFSLVRFRSASGKAKEICIIFIAMASGLAFGMGYLAYGVIFTIVSGLIMMVCSITKIFDKKVDNKKKRLKITIPEDLDYTGVFDEVFTEYTDTHNLVKVKSVNMGSMFRVTYDVTLKDASLEKKFLDDLRIRNGNLEISLEHVDLENQEL